MFAAGQVLCACKRAWLSEATESILSFFYANQSHSELSTVCHCHFLSCNKFEVGWQVVVSAGSAQKSSKINHWPLKKPLFACCVVKKSFHKL